MKGLKICCLTGCAIFMICCSAVWASSTTGENRAAGLKDTHASHTLSTQLKPRKDVTSFQTSRRKKAEVGDVLTAAAIGTAVGGPIGGLIGAALCVAFCKDPPPPIHGNWGNWRNTGHCSKSCGGGSQRIVRNCDNPPPQRGGRPCSGIYSMSVACNPQSCPINGNWSEWMESGVCSAECDYGVQLLVRECDSPRPEHGGLECRGEKKDTKDCYRQDCPGCFHPPVPEGVVYYSDVKLPENVTDSINGNGGNSTDLMSVFDHKDVLSFGCLSGFRAKNKPPQGQTFHTLTCSKGEWKGATPVCNDINECSEDRHGCDPVRSNCSNTLGGFKCYCLKGYEEDENDECKAVVIHGGWGDWSASGECSVSCGLGGMKRFERRCDNPRPQNGGEPCRGDDFKFEPCNTHCCPVHGMWSEWTDGACSKTCDYGVRTKYRSCVGPYCGGRECRGVEEVNVECNERPCKGCPVPVPPEGVLFHIGDNVTEIDHDQELSYTCGKGFDSAFNDISQSFPTIQCVGGIWEGENPFCEDKDECALGINDCNPETSICVNTLGSYVCHCKEGFALDADGRTCEDFNECEMFEDNHCQHECANSFGSFQCYCHTGYELDEDGLRCEHPSSECSELSVPGNGSVDCQKITAGLRCTLSCDDDFEFGSSYDVSPQTCINGIWRYAEEEQDIPDCVAVEDAGLSLTIFEDLSVACDELADLTAEVGGLGGDASAFAECLGEGRKRATGRLRLAITLSQTPPKGCLKSSSCRRLQVLILSFKASAVISKAKAGHIKINVTDTKTSEVTEVQLSGSLKPVSNTVQRTCAPGTVLNVYTCVPCGAGTYYSTSGPRARCVPCSKNSYQDGQKKTSCKPCPRGMFTRSQGSKSVESCLSPCAPGTFSKTGLAPCDKCPVSTYQPDSGKTFCHRCEFDQLTNTEGATSKGDCGCPNGTYWQNCSKVCPCVNGGSCRVDGACICPKGWTGPNCSEPNPFGECQDSYFVGFLSNKNASQDRHVFLLSGKMETSVDLSLPGYIKELTVVPHSIADVSITPGVPIVTQFSAYSSDQSIILGYNAESTSADTCASFPVQANYKEIEEYRAVSFSRSYFDNSYNSTVLVIGAEDNTKVQVTTTEDAVGYLNSVNGHTYSYIFRKGKMMSITISKYESLNISSVMDLTGTVIKAFHPVAVYSGHECASVPSYSSKCGHLVEQIPPVNVLGTCYAAAAFAGRESGDYVRAVAVNPETYIKVKCSLSGEVSYSGQFGPYSDGEFLEFYMAMDWHCTFESNKPTMVVQISGGIQGVDYSDPFMVVLSDVQQLMNELPFYSVDFSGENFNHYINVVVPKEFFNTTAILLDEDPLSTYEYLTEEVKFDKCGSFVVMRLAVTPGYHFLRHLSPEAGLGLTVYGFAADTSYGYSPGFNQATSCNSA